jgi:hypothetical protein
VNDLRARAPLRTLTLAWLERALTCGVLAGALTGLLLVLGNDLAPVRGPLGFGLTLGLWAAGLFGLAALGLGLAGALTARLAHRPGLSRVLLGPAALIFVGFAAAELAPLLPPSPAFAVAPRFSALGPPAVALVALALLGVAWLPARRARLARGLALAALALTALALAPQPPAPPAGESPAVTLAVARPRLAAAPLLVFGIDGGDWDFVEPLLARGDLPALQALRARGAWGVLKTQRPTLSPVVWTTIATGRSPARHGVHGFVTDYLRGVDAPLPELRAVGPGAAGLLALLPALGAVDAGPVRSDARRVPAFWNLATREGSPVNVVDWWATWPAERVLGALVSERVYYRPEAALEGTRLTFPDDLAARLRRLGLVARREQVSYDEARRFVELTPAEFEALASRPARERTLEAQLTYFCALTETDRRVARHLTEEGRRRFGRPPDLMVLFRLVDMVSHTSARFSELVDDHLGATPDELRRYGRVVSEAYRTVDRALGELLAAFGPEANAVVVSDHGFELQSHAPEWTPSYDHRNGAAGMFLAAGPAFRAGRVDGLSVLDVFPLLAELKGFPLADDLEGRPARRALGGLFLARAEPRRVATYGARDAGGAGAAGGPEDPELLERLRALGYLQ